MHIIRNSCFFKSLTNFQAGTKLVCAVLSLPVPSKSASLCGEPMTNQVSRSVHDYFEQRTLQKILLVGYNGSGTSTIFKQVVIYKGSCISNINHASIQVMLGLRGLHVLLDRITELIKTRLGHVTHVVIKFIVWYRLRFCTKTSLFQRTSEKVSR